MPGLTPPSLSNVGLSSQGSRQHPPTSSYLGDDREFFLLQQMGSFIKEKKSPYSSCFENALNKSIHSQDKLCLLFAVGSCQC